jgi:hypothetical protein
MSMVEKREFTEYEITEMASHAMWKNLERSIHELTLAKSTFPFRMVMRSRFNLTPIIRPLQRELKEYGHK